MYRVLCAINILSRIVFDDVTRCDNISKYCQYVLYLHSDVNACLCARILCCFGVSVILLSLGVWGRRVT